MSSAAGETVAGTSPIALSSVRLIAFDYDPLRPIAVTEDGLVRILTGIFIDPSALPILPGEDLTDDGLDCFEWNGGRS